MTKYCSQTKRYPRRNILTKKGWYNDDDNDDKKNANKTPTTPTTNRMIVVQMGGGKQLRNIVWQECDDPTSASDRIRYCVRATRYRGRTIEHTT